MAYLKVYSNPVMPLAWLFFMLLLLCDNILFAQNNEVIPELDGIHDTSLWTLSRRQATYQNGEVHLDAKLSDGILWLKDLEFSDGTISFSVKGKDDPGKSFVGLAFHGQNDSTYEAVYFRPFNFRNPDRKAHAVQYISHPAYPWDKLRRSHPGKYENAIQPVVDPNEWFQVRIEVDRPLIRVYVNGVQEPSLEVTQLISNGKGWVGFWVGYNSEGSFKDLKIKPAASAQ
ncbi:family 16 glycoside hydrolase [Cesiribacter sp. SM1]|uniref:family 16 glycoside hydrolase n=1 Tax=Cesiribacter sp. SM1 TaxID=2861196 RepID=UPI001CD76CF4|nr:family 16 glycoside hydrolase [Cesiribacter sp. SM1]